MNRPIKFRAWTGEKMEYFTFASLDGNRLVYADPIVSLSDCEVMQYTGLEDKNGKKIYEGDIVISGGYSGVVEWGDFSSGNCETWMYGDDEALTYGSTASRSEVVGNIYENPLVNIK